MDGYYQSQASIPYYRTRQRGSGFGTFVGRTAIPILRKFVLPAAKRIGKELIQEAAPELLDVVSGKTKPKQALKNTAKKTVRKQFAGGRVKKSKTQKKRVIRNNTRKRNSRIRKDILGNLQ